MVIEHFRGHNQQEDKRFVRFNRTKYNNHVDLHKSTRNKKHFEDEDHSESVYYSTALCLSTSPEELGIGSALVIYRRNF